MEKFCRTCSVSKKLEMFYERGDKKGRGYQSSCKVCVIERQRKRRKMFPELLKDRDLKGSFGFGLDVYKEMLTAQGGKCAICEKDHTEFKRGLSVDHCHSTMAIRGLLCMGCNTGLGKFLDNVRSLEKAIVYLKQNPTRRFKSR